MCGSEDVAKKFKKYNYGWQCKAKNYSGPDLGRRYNDVPHWHHDREIEK